MNKILLFLLIIICLFTTSCNVNTSKYKIEEIELVDSLVYQNAFEKSVGIPSKLETKYIYKVRLTNETTDTIIKMTTRSKEYVNELLGDSVALYK